MNSVVTVDLKGYYEELSEIPIYHGAYEQVRWTLVTIEDDEQLSTDMLDMFHVIRTMISMEQNQDLPNRDAFSEMEQLHLHFGQLIEEINQLLETNSKYKKQQELLHQVAHRFKLKNPNIDLSHFGDGLLSASVYVCVLESAITSTITHMAGTEIKTRIQERCKYLMTDNPFLSIVEKNLTFAIDNTRFSVDSYTSRIGSGAHAFINSATVRIPKIYNLESSKDLRILTTILIHELLHVAFSALVVQCKSENGDNVLKDLTNGFNMPSVIDETGKVIYVADSRFGYGFNEAITEAISAWLESSELMPNNISCADFFKGPGDIARNVYVWEQDFFADRLSQLPFHYILNIDNYLGVRDSIESRRLFIETLEKFDISFADVENDFLSNFDTEHPDSYPSHEHDGAVGSSFYRANYIYPDETAVIPRKPKLR